MGGRLSATVLDASGTTHLQKPHAGEDLFLYVTDGTGTMVSDEGEIRLGQYDVLLARSDAPAATFTAGDSPLHFLSFYLPGFIPSES